MNTYRTLRDAPELDAKEGDIIELELSEQDETDMLAAKRLEIVPRAYKVVGGSFVFETPPDGVFEAALGVGQEGLLIAGGHIKRVAGAPVKRTTKKKEA